VWGKYGGMKDKDSLILENLYESIGKTWCAVILDEDSRKRLYDHFKDMIPKDWNVACSHMTIDGKNPLLKEEDLGKQVNLEAFRYYASPQYMSIEVTGYPRQNNFQPPHVSIAEIQEHLEVKPYPPPNKEKFLDIPIRLSGTVENVSIDRRELNRKYNTHER
jgi:hypothetical protein